MPARRDPPPYGDGASNRSVSQRLVLDCRRIRMLVMIGDQTWRQCGDDVDVVLTVLEARSEPMEGNHTEQAIKAAKSIREDRHGADYYQDPEILTDFLVGQFGGSREQGKKVADAILSDRRGADYYADEELLAQFLSGQFE